MPPIRTWPASSSSTTGARSSRPRGCSTGPRSTTTWRRGSRRARRSSSGSPRRARPPGTRRTRRAAPRRGSTPTGPRPSTTTARPCRSTGTPPTSPTTDPSSRPWGRVRRQPAPWPSSSRASAWGARPCRRPTRRPAGVAAWEAAGYTDSVWLHALETIASVLRSRIPGDAGLPDGRPDLLRRQQDRLRRRRWPGSRASPNWGLQDDGLSATQSLGPQWSGVPVALEQLDATQTSGDCLCADICQGSGRCTAATCCSTGATSRIRPTAGYLTRSPAQPAPEHCSQFVASDAET